MNCSTTSSRFSAAILFLSSLLGAQTCVPFLPSGQPLYAGSPTCVGIVAAPVLCAVGNAGFALVGPVAPPPVPPGALRFMLIGSPIAAPLPIPVPPLFPGYGVPGFLAIAPATIFAAFNGPAGVPVAYPLPVPPGLCGLGIELVAQALVLVPAPGLELALSHATKIMIP